MSTTEQESTNTFVLSSSRHEITPPTTPPSPSPHHQENGKQPLKSSTLSSTLDNNAHNIPTTDMEQNNQSIDQSNSNLHSNSNSNSNSTKCDGERELKEIARKLFKEDFISIQPEEYTQFLAANDTESASIRSYYMDLFRWDEDLLKSTRMLCSKLYLKGESQEIDRILSSFTKSFIRQHPVNVFCTKNFEKIYIILYSLILLNTALHNSEVNKKSKISQADYIKNTFNTFLQNPRLLKKLSIKQRIGIERVLGTYYDDLAKNELHLKQQDSLELEKIEKTKKNRLSLVESVSSFMTSSNLQSQNTPNIQTPIPQVATSVNNTPFNENMFGDNHQSSRTSRATEAKPNGPFNHPLPPVPQDDLPSLSRQVSGSSIWSTDTNGNRRGSMSLKRLSTSSSTVTSYSSANGSSTTLGSRNARVGFTRALLSDQNYLKFQHDSIAVRNRQSLSQLRGAPQLHQLHSSLNRRSSRASIVSRESGGSHLNDDVLSSLSLDTLKMNETENEGYYQNLDDFNVDDYQDHYDLTLELQGSPYLKEGLLKIKILNNDQQDNSLTNTTEISQGPNAPQTTAGRFFSFFSKGSAPAAPKETFATTTGTGGIPRFAENFVVVSKGELLLYSFDPKVIKKHQQKMKKMQQQIDQDDDVIGDGNWLKNAANIGNYNLCSTYAQLEKTLVHSHGGSGGNKIYWSLTFPKVSKKTPKKFIFEAGTTEIALEFINTCNFWAAKITAIPTSEESMSSIEYGWTNLESLVLQKENFKKLKYIQKWDLLPQGTFLSNYMVVNNEMTDQENHLGMMKQFVRTLNYYNHLKKNYREFNQMKAKFVKNFNFKGYNNTSNYQKVMSNYEAKNEHYKFEMDKYKNYLIVLGFGLQLRFDLEDQDKEDKIADQSNDVPEAEDSAQIQLVENPQDSDLTNMIKYEISKIFVNMKDISKIIPTFASSRSLNNLSEVRKNGLPEAPNGSTSPMVKSPKSHFLTEFKENESPVTQLLQTTTGTGTTPEEIRRDELMMHSYSTSTIKEEEEPDSDSAIGLKSTSPFSLGSINSVTPATLNVAKAHIVKVAD